MILGTVRRYRKYTSTTGVRQPRLFHIVDRRQTYRLRQTHVDDLDSVCNASLFFAAKVTFTLKVMKSCHTLPTIELDLEILVGRWHHSKLEKDSNKHSSDRYSRQT